MAHGRVDSRPVRRRGGGTSRRHFALPLSTGADSDPSAHTSQRTCSGSLVPVSKSRWGDRAKAAIDRSQNGSTGSAKMALALAAADIRTPFTGRTPVGKGIFDASQPVSAWSFWPLAGYADGALPVAPAVSGRDTGFYRLNLSPSDTDRRGQSLDPSQKKFNNRLVGPTSRDEKALDSNRGPFSLARKHLRLPSRFNEIHRIGGFVGG